MATTLEKKRWKEEMLKDHPHMEQLPSFIDTMIQYYLENRKDFNKIVRQIKEEEEKKQRDSKVEAEDPRIFFGIRKGEPELSRCDYDDEGNRIEELRDEHQLGPAAEPGDDDGQPAEPRDP